MKSLYDGKKGLTSEENFKLAYRIRSGDLKAREIMIEGNAGFAYKRAIKYAGKNSGWTHMDDDDILQSAMLGLIDAVDKYDPDKGYAFTTYAHWWILKRIDEEITANHWNTMRPPRSLMRSFLYRKFDYEESGEYMNKFMSRDDITEIDHNRYIDQGYEQSEIDDLIITCNLSENEARVYHVIYGENPYEDDLSDLNKKTIIELEENMLDKVRSSFE